MRTFTQKQKPTQQTRSASPIPHSRAFFAQNHGGRSIPHLQRDPTTTASTRLGPNRVGPHFSQIPLYAQATSPLQPNLSLSKPGDLDEQAADRVADQVMRLPEQPLQRTCTCGGDCPKCQAGPMGHAHEGLHTSNGQANDPVEATVPPIVHDVLGSPGRPLDTATRDFMEPRFGHDFSRVRVHTGGRATQSAQAVDARAFTVGQQIVFQTAAFNPGSHAGKALLAHELAHVVQQEAKSPPRLQRQPVSEPDEEQPAPAPSGAPPAAQQAIPWHLGLPHIVFDVYDAYADRFYTAYAGGMSNRDFPAALKPGPVRDPATAGRRLDFRRPPGV